MKHSVILTTNAQTRQLNQKISTRLGKFPGFSGGKNNSSRFPGVLDTLIMYKNLQQLVLSGKYVAEHYKKLIRR